jgi:hypothetical protein
MGNEENAEPSEPDWHTNAERRIQSATLNPARAHTRVHAHHWL